MVGLRAERPASARVTISATPCRSRPPDTTHPTQRFTTPAQRPRTVRATALYEELRDQGDSKKKAPRISNAAAGKPRRAPKRTRSSPHADLAIGTPRSARTRRPPSANSRHRWTDRQPPVQARVPSSLSRITLTSTISAKSAEPSTPRYSPRWSRHRVSSCASRQPTRMHPDAPAYSKLSALSTRSPQPSPERSVPESHRLVPFRHAGEHPPTRRSLDIDSRAPNTDSILNRSA